MRRRYELHAWLTGTYRAIGVADKFWTRAGAQRAADHLTKVCGGDFEYTIWDTKTGRTITA
jgi:hypothetical protein